MNDKSRLLDQLRLDRTEEAVPPAKSGKLWWTAAGVTASVLAVGYFAFRAPPRAAPAAPVAAAPVVAKAPEVKRESALLDASGYVVASRQATVSAKTIGRLTEVRVEEGQAVSANEIVARVEDSSTRAALEEAQARVDQAEVTRDAAAIAMDDAERIFNRERLQRVANVISAQDFDNARSQFDTARSDYLVKQRLVEVARASLEMAQRNQDDTIMRAPFSGRVTVKTAQVGETVSPSAAGGGFTRTGICTIVDMDSLGVEVDISENSIHRVHAGQRATVKLNAYPDWEIPAQVTAIVPVADRSKATVKVRVGFSVKDARILPESGARVAFLADEPKSADPAALDRSHPGATRTMYAKESGVTSELTAKNGN